MALLLKKIVQGYFWLFDEIRDERSDSFPLMSTPFHPLAIGIFYLFLIKKWLPEYMKDRPPFKLQNTLIIFNFSQVLINAYIFYYGLKESLKLNWICSPVDYSDTPQNRFLLKVIYLYFMTKIFDLSDTIFFILRGKMTQASFLHIYHHFGMIGVGWVGVRFLGGGHSLYVGAVNSFVHIVMYFYYLLTIWKPEYKKSIWWKKHITQLQLAQFVFFFITYGQLLLNQQCAFPKIASYMMVPQSMFMMTLFGDFYYRAYIKKKTQ